MRTKEVADICGVSVQTVVTNAREIGKEIKHGVATEWSEEDLKNLQLVLMKNQVNQGVATQGGIVESNCQIDLTLGVLTQKAMEDPEASDQLAKLLTSNANNLRRAKKLEVEKSELEAKNQLLIEQKEAAEAETARVFQYNKNFHSNLYTATDLAKILGTTANKIGRIANEQGLKQEPLYGKLGKIQLNNGRWCNIFYYNDDAKTVIENNL